MGTVISFVRIRSLFRNAGQFVLVMLAAAILWKGGKTLEMTWVLVAVAWVCNVAYRRKSEIQNIPIWLWGSVILFILWTAVSYWYSMTRNYGLDEVLRTGALGLIFLWCCRAAGRNARSPLEGRNARSPLENTMDMQSGHSWPQAIVQVITFVTLLACSVGVLVYIFQPVDRFVGTFFDFRFHTDYWPNAWAEYLLLAWPVVWLWVREDVPNRIFALGLVLGSLALSYSRAAWLVFIGQVILWLWLQRDCSLLKEQKNIVRIGTIVLLALGIFFAVNGLRSQMFPVQSVTEKVTFTAAEGGSSISERRDFLGQAFALAWMKPIFGWGPYSFRFVQPHVQTGVLATSDHPHNVFLKFAAERGIAAAVLFGLIVGFVILNAWKQKKDLALVVALSGVLAHNLIDYNLQFVGIALPFWLLLGVLVGQTFEEPETAERKTFRLVELILATALLVLAVVEGRHLVVSSLGRHAEASGDAHRALVWYDHAGGELFSRDLHLSRTHLLIDLQRYSEAEVALEDYMKQNEEDFRAWRLKGDLLFAQRRYDEALGAYERAHVVGRWNDLGIPRGIIETLVQKGDFLFLKERLPQIEFWLQQFADAIIRNSHFVALSTNVEEFVRITDRLAQLYPADAPRYQLLGARVDRHAREERERIISRGPGWLW